MDINVKAYINKPVVNKTIIMDNKNLCTEFENLINSDCSEETIHQFLKNSIFKSGNGSSNISERFIMGNLSKFPITTDRIPDFTIALINVRESQRHSRLTFIELKKPSSLLYSSHSRMSKDLNDAWMECMETSRLIADNFRDVLRRIVMSIKKDMVKRFDSKYNEQLKNIKNDERSLSFYDSLIPACNSIIVIGRRSSLDSEGLLRTRELTASTRGAISVITYDTILDWLKEANNKDADDEWNFFHRAWYW